jgi:hypothetical protein
MASTPPTRRQAGKPRSSIRPSIRSTTQISPQQRPEFRRNGPTRPGEHSSAATVNCRRTRARNPKRQRSRLHLRRSKSARTAKFQTNPLSSSASPKPRHADAFGHGRATGNSTAQSSASKPGKRESPAKLASDRPGQRQQIQQRADPLQRRAPVRQRRGFFRLQPDPRQRHDRT